MSFMQFIGSFFFSFVAILFDECRTKFLSSNPHWNFWAKRNSFSIAYIWTALVACNVSLAIVLCPGQIWHLRKVSPSFWSDTFSFLRKRKVSVFRISNVTSNIYLPFCNFQEKTCKSLEASLCDWFGWLNWVR